MTSKDDWCHVDLGYKIKKPKLRRKPIRPRKTRIKAYDEIGTSKKRNMCSECNELGHTAKTCQGGPTASQKRMKSQDGSGQGGNDPIAPESARKEEGAEEEQLLGGLLLCWVSMLDV